MKKITTMDNQMRALSRWEGEGGALGEDAPHQPQSSQ